MFDLAAVSMRYGAREVLHDIYCCFAPGEMVAIVGPNGAGKSTLLHIMAGLQRAHTGECRYRGRPVRDWRCRDFAREVSYVPQTVHIGFGFTAEQVVLMGRTPFGDGLFESDADRAAVDHAMRLTDTVAFRHRDFRTLSGGERQRVILAAALAQSPSALLLDEPTTFLDIHHQLALYGVVRGLCAEGLLAVAVTHDLNLAAAYADRVLVLREGVLVSAGGPSDTLTGDTIERAFGVRVAVNTSPAGRPWITYGG